MKSAQFEALAERTKTCPFSGYIASIQFWCESFAPWGHGGVHLQKVIFDASIREQGLTIEEKLTFFEEYWVIGEKVSIRKIMGQKSSASEK